MSDEQRVQVRQIDQGWVVAIDGVNRLAVPWGQVVRDRPAPAAVPGTRAPAHAPQR